VESLVTSTTIVKNIGRFELKENLGSGSIATLYKAYDTRQDTEVALKVFYAYFTKDTPALDVLRRELDILSSLRHPNLVRVYEYGEDSGYIWVVQEYVSDKTLRDLVEGKVRPDLALDIGIQLADVLGEAHKLGLVHGDIKPSNVFLSERGHVRLSDFAMAPMVAMLPFAMRMGMSTPMPGFMSPEQASGVQLDERSDVYSLGLLLYWLLTGDIPFYGNSPETVYAKQMKSPAPPPSQFNPLVSAGLDNILMKALAPFPTIRYGSMKDFKEDLAAELEAAKSQAMTTFETGLNYGKKLAPVTIPYDDSDSVVEADSIEARRRAFKWITWTSRSMSRRKRIIIYSAVCTALTLFLVSYWTYGYVKANISFLPPPVSAASLDESVGQWASHRGDLLNSGYRVALPTPIKGNVKWKYAINGPFYNSPIVLDDRVYIGTGDNRLISLDDSNGSVAWEWKTTGPMDASPIAADGRIYLGLRDKRIVALDATSGKELWDFFTENPILASSTVKDGILYAGSGDGVLYALDAATGDLRWSFATGSWILSTPAFMDGLVVTGSEDGWLYIIRASTGAKVLTYYTGGAIHSSQAIDDKKRIYVTNRTGRIWAIDGNARDEFLGKERQGVHAQFYLWNIADPPPPQKGTLWGTRKRGEVLTSPAVANDMVVVGSTSGKVYAFNAADGSPVWESAIGSPVSSAPTIGDGVIYIGDDSGKLNALEFASGKSLWSVQLDGKVRSSPALGDKALYVTTESGVLYAIE